MPMLDRKGVSVHYERMGETSYEFPRSDNAMFW